jgi:hypothetical protein
LRKEIKKRDGETGGWGKLHNEELHNLYSFSSVNRMMKSRTLKWAGHVARTGEKRTAFRISVGKSEGKRSLGKTRQSMWIIIKYVLEG